MNPFEYVNSINSNKKNMMRNTDNDELAEKSYSPYVVNKALSYFTDTLLYANEMNRLSFLDNKLQYEYLLKSVRVGKRFSKWSKKEDINSVEAIAKYYQCNFKRAQEYMDILPKLEIERILEEMANL